MIEARDVERVATLQHPTRSALYDELTRRDEWMTRDALAAAVGVPRHAATFHLERMAEVGLLQTRFERTSGKTGPGAGRPAKLYRRSREESSVCMPARNYRLAADVMAAALERSGASARRSLVRQARRAGAEMGAAARPQTLDDAFRRLRALGYEPGMQGKRLVLRNCPFDALARCHADVVCDMNVALLRGLVGPQLTARPDPKAGRCCVVITSGDTDAKVR
jgi:predicted ArsR family transcriptional regulator